MRFVGFCPFVTSQRRGNPLKNFLEVVRFISTEYEAMLQLMWVLPSHKLDDTQDLA